MADTQGDGGKTRAVSGIVVGEYLESASVRVKGSNGPGHRLLKLRTPNGKHVIVDAGEPDARLPRITYRKGDRIVAIGKMGRLGGRPVLYARHIGELQKLHHGPDEMPPGTRKR